MTDIFALSVQKLPRCFETIGLALGRASYLLAIPLQQLPKISTEIFEAAVASSGKSREYLLELACVCVQEL